MDTQTLINLLFMIVIGGGGWFIKTMWERMERFLEKEEFNRLYDLFVNRFDRLEQLIEKKQDK